jgi:hypothetical protein
MKFQHATIEWLWDSNAMRVNLPGGKENQMEASYPELVETMCKLGAEGWEVATCAAAGNWLFWTLKKTVG